jgi:CarD family transcriptional regulator
MEKAYMDATTQPPAHFDVGDVVVHPRHGAGDVVARRRRVVEGCARIYLEIELTATSLRIMVPCDATAAVGLRPIVGPRRLREIVDVLEAAPAGADRNWSARRKHYRAQLESGDVLALAATIRDLAARAPLSTGERDLYQHSHRVLASELAYALGVDADEAGAFIDDHIGTASFSSGSHGPP